MTILNSANRDSTIIIGSGARPRWTSSSPRSKPTFTPTSLPLVCGFLLGSEIIGRRPRHLRHLQVCCRLVDTVCKKLALQHISQQIKPDEPPNTSNGETNKAPNFK
ncbi:hypothetical protein TorRG33x02_298950 [Trema orientale]|uniref:Uncharacterized protein n=1 Tax=Trema orientale TaxID=63057 RepID=A0A2P5C3G5_TREOI|nr:hypothetical protein TorRG33x02_298950 [Trema orientale]